jgi:Adenylosuccinate synthetase
MYRLALAHRHSVSSCCRVCARNMAAVPDRCCNITGCVATAYAVTSSVFSTTFCSCMPANALRILCSLFVVLHTHCTHTLLQWGDEGKGKLVDILAQTYDVCARVAGGSNAGNEVFNVLHYTCTLRLYMWCYVSMQSTCCLLDTVSLQCLHCHAW